MSGTGRIADLVRKLEVVGSQSWRRNLSQAMADESKKLVDRGFRTQSDPYGQPWAPIKRKGRILQKTGWMRMGWQLSAPMVTDSGFTISCPAEYAGYQQEGTSRITPRMMVPTRANGLGEWEEPLNKVVVKSFLEAMK